jgi:hypothetical protein
MLAMLEDALRCREKYRDAKDRRGKKLFREAEEWLLSETEDWIFSLGKCLRGAGIESRAYLQMHAPGVEKTIRDAVEKERFPGRTRSR